MKKILPVLLLLFSLPAFSQDTTRILSQMESMLFQKNKLIKRESATLGAIRGYSIFKIKVTDEENGSNQTGIILSRNSGLTTHPNIYFDIPVDSSDIPGILSLLEKVSNLTVPGNYDIQANPVSYSFITSNGVVFRYNCCRNDRVYPSIEIYEQYRVYKLEDRGIRVSVRERDFGDLIGMLKRF